MLNLAKLEFATLDISSKNYLSWVLDAEIHLDAKGLGNTILAYKEASNQDKTKKNLKKRFDHQKTVILLKACYDWMHLRLQDIKIQQYREKGFKRYFELISCLLVAEQNNELLIKNHGIRLIGFAPFPEVNVAVHNNYENIKYKGPSRGRGCSGRRGRGCSSNRYHGGYNNDTSNHTKRITMKDKKKVVIIILQRLLRLYATDVV
ncbi:hypothetical protein J1N35_043638 [Gossypium stocksii]|uniref:Uncharacterized protein n=1 Tax=Gossypium stocksii TaxID=47602 RepID=A0A9D3U7V3_9ROSI|nr:hypothetical protein J1N35_043638 [Gossypium stocksii]